MNKWLLPLAVLLLIAAGMIGYRLWEGGPTKGTVQGLVRQILSGRGDHFNVDSVQIVAIGAELKNNWSGASYYPFRCTARITSKSSGKSVERTFDGNVGRDVEKHWILDTWCASELDDWRARAELAQ